MDEKIEMIEPNFCQKHRVKYDASGKCFVCNHTEQYKAKGTKPEDIAVTGVKFDTDKPRMDLFSTIWLNGVAKVLGFGAKKYSADNWRLGMARRRLTGAALRHIFAYQAGEDLDLETGLSHLDHASCCLMFARELHVTKPETDDRFKEYSPSAPESIGTFISVKGGSLSLRQGEFFSNHNCLPNNGHSLEVVKGGLARCLICERGCY